MANACAGVTAELSLYDQKKRATVRQTRRACGRSRLKPPLRIAADWVEHITTHRVRAAGKPLSDKGARLLFALVQHFNAGTFDAFPGRQRLASCIGASERQTQRALRELLAHDLAPIIQIQRGRQTPLYKFSTRALRLSGLKRRRGAAPAAVVDTPAAPRGDTEQPSGETSGSTRGDKPRVAYKELKPSGKSFRNTGGKRPQRGRDDSGVETPPTPEIHTTAKRCTEYFYSYRPSLKPTSRKFDETVALAAQLLLDGSTEETLNAASRFVGVTRYGRADEWLICRGLHLHSQHIWDWLNVDRYAAVAPPAPAWERQGVSREEWEEAQSREAALAAERCAEEARRLEQRQAEEQAGRAREKAEAEKLAEAKKAPQAIPPSTPARSQADMAREAFRRVASERASKGLDTFFPVGVEVGGLVRGLAVAM